MSLNELDILKIILDNSLSSLKFASRFIMIVFLLINNLLIAAIKLGTGKVDKITSGLKLFAYLRNLKNESMVLLLDNWIISGLLIIEFLATTIFTSLFTLRALNIFKTWFSAPPLLVS